MAEEQQDNGIKTVSTNDVLDRCCNALTGGGVLLHGDDDAFSTDHREGGTVVLHAGNNGLSSSVLPASLKGGAEDRADRSENGTEDIPQKDDDDFNPVEDSPGLTLATTSSSTNSDMSSEEKQDEATFNEKWERFVHAISLPIKKVLLAMTSHAAHHPKYYIVVITVVSLLLIVTGLFTNFYLESNENELWKPIGAQSTLDGEWFDTQWVNEYNGKSKKGRKLEEDDNDGDGGGDGKKKKKGETKFITVLIHAQGDNVVTVDGAQHLFDMVERVQTYPGYKEYCSEYGEYAACPEGYDFLCALSDIPYGEDAPPVCGILGVSSFWLHNSTVFHSQVETDEDVGKKLSQDIFPGEDTKFNIKHFVGQPEFDEEKQLTHGVSYATLFIIDKGVSSTELERNVLEGLLNLRDDWASNTTDPYVLEVFASVSFPDEFNRGIVKDIPLVPLVFVVMSIFTCFVFIKRDAVESRSLLGFGAVVCVMLSLLTGYGLMFCIGVPFTSLTQVIPFVIFGIGLDDSYILISSYSRTNHELPAVERVKYVVDEVGMSIFMTTATSVSAFALGCISSLPAIRWLCLYAFVTIFVDFIYQITFFIALLVIDERRVQDNRRDWLCCFKVKRANEEPQHHILPEPHISERVMAWYAERLFHPWVKRFVLASFAALSVVCAISASQLKLEFDFTSVLPDDSYIIPFNDALQTYASLPTVSAFVFFRDVDQSDPKIQAQMESYIDDLWGLEYISDRPFRFWLYDFKTYKEENEADLDGVTFDQAIHRFIADKAYNVYKDDFVFDEYGIIKASRTKISMDNLDQSNVDEILGALRGQRRVGSEQPINQGKKEWAFFTFDIAYYLWEFLNVTVSELKVTTIVGILAVSVMGVLFLPHWSGVLFVGPMISILYVDLMGVLQMADIPINGVSYVSLVMSIGLLVDFIVHFAHQFFESDKIGREERAKDVLRTMGSAILLGGVSTFLGAMPLALASNEVLRTFFVTFVGIVTLGVAHGLILFPVILSYVGPN